MKISLTGSSSTGKTTLAMGLMSSEKFKKIVSKFIYVDGRNILKQMGCQHMDKMSREQQKKFQLEYYKKKLELEENQDNYLTDRSFVDIAAYWLVRDTYDQSSQEQNLLLKPCKNLALKYDYTFYLPTGIIDFEKDGYRPERPEFNELVDNKIRNFLKEWKINYYTIKDKSLTKRLNFILKTITNSNTI